MVVWFLLGIIGLVMLFAQIRLFFIDSKLQNIFDKMEQMLNEMRKEAAASNK